jgi:hypothetical protein
MGRSENDALWDPRPRLQREEEHVVGRIENVPEEEAADATAGRQAEDASGPLSVLVELESNGSAPAALDWARGLQERGIEVDEEFGAIPLGSQGQSRTFCVRVELPDRSQIAELEEDPRVVKVWGDSQIAPFSGE